MLGLATEEKARRERILVSLRNKAEHAIVAHLKYVCLNQRNTRFESLPKRRRLESSRRSFRELDRLPPLAFPAAGVEDGLFANLTGAPCPSSSCALRVGRYNQSGTLGRFTLSKKNKKQGLVDLTTQNGSFRCHRCRGRVSASFRNRLFPWDRNLVVGVLARRCCLGTPFLAPVLFMGTLLSTPCIFWTPPFWPRLQGQMDVPISWASRSWPCTFITYDTVNLSMGRP